MNRIFVGLIVLMSVFGAGAQVWPLPVDASRSFEAAGAGKEVLERVPLSSGEVSVLKIPTTTGVRAVGSPDDPDYATYGSRRIEIPVEKTDWRDYNRIAFQIFPDAQGATVVNLDLSFAGVGHLVNLREGVWNECFLDIENVERGDIKKITFGASIKGRASAAWPDTLVYRIANVELQKVAGLDPESGWAPAEGKIIYSTSGYLTGSEKTAIVTAAGDRFEILRGNKVVFEGEVSVQKTTLGEFRVADFSAFDQAGQYVLRVGSCRTPVFAISDTVWESSLWKTLSFLYSQRCGFAVPGVHDECHADLFSVHDGRRISYAGGWHDAGDLSQQTLQTGDVTYSLLEAAEAVSDPALSARLREEARWGLDFIVKQRYGDGYRASSMGLVIWTDGEVGTFDDIESVRVQNFALDNFLHSAYEAYGAMVLDDPELARVAREDFDFALARHREVGYGEFGSMYEHTLNTSEAQYMASASWAASMLYRLTGEEKYATLAAEFIEYTLACQDERGFFWRDKARRSIVHYIHQSREQTFVQALTLLCETQPEHASRAEWVRAIEGYGSYLKSMAHYTAPYGMAPSGIYHTDEYLDEPGFSRLHLWAPANAAELYGEQIRGGVALGGGFYVRRFPVWFSIFNGNTAVHLSTGKAAALCGKFLNDRALLDLGLEQMYWTVGKNPFGQSLIYGEGWNYPQMDSFSSGEMTGEMPVGIRSLGNTDEPYWPRVNTACYKEVWVTSAGKWMGLAAEYGGKLKVESGKLATRKENTAQKNILVLTERGGQHGPFTDAGLEWLRGLDGYEVTEINDTSEINDGFLARFDAIVQLDYPPYRWTATAQRAFEKYIDRGLGGWVGFHHATLLGEFDGYPIWPWFRDFMGGVRFENYIAGLADGTVAVERAEHPVTRGVSRKFTIERDEWYTFDANPRSGGVEVLAAVDENSYSPASDVRMGDHPVVWTNPTKSARNVYFLMGHTAELYDNPDFTKMFENALEWTATP